MMRAGVPHIDIDEEKSERAQRKVKEYQEKRKGEVDEEDKEF